MEMLVKGRDRAWLATIIYSLYPMAALACMLMMHTYTCMVWWTVLYCVWVQLLSIKHRQGHVLATGPAINYTDWLVPSSLYIIVAKITEMTKMTLLLTHSFVVLCLLQCDWSAV